MAVKLLERIKVEIINAGVRNPVAEKADDNGLSFKRSYQNGQATKSLTLTVFLLKQCYKGQI